jgi:hypothetical protein
MDAGLASRTKGHERHSTQEARFRRCQSASPLTHGISQHLGPTDSVLYRTTSGGTSEINDGGGS